MNPQGASNRSLGAALQHFDRDHVTFGFANHPLSDTEHALGHIIDGDTLDIEAGSGGGGEDLDVFLHHCGTGYRESLRLLALEHDVAARNDGDGRLVVKGQGDGGGTDFSVTTNHLYIDDIAGHSSD